MSGGSAHGSLNSLRLSQAGGRTGGDDNNVNAVVDNGNEGPDQGLQLNHNSGLIGRGAQFNGNQQIQAQAQQGRVEWNDWSWSEDRNAGNDQQSAAGGDYVQNNELMGGSDHERMQTQGNQPQVPQHPLQQQQQSGHEATAQTNNLPGVQLQNTQLDAVALQNAGIPPNLPPAAHPFYTWMLQQQQQQQAQILSQQQAQILAQAQLQQQVQAQQQEQERLKREEAERLQRKQQEEAQRRQQEEARRQQSQSQSIEMASSNLNPLQQLTSNSILNPQLRLATDANMTPQQQLALFQYQLALGQAQQNSNVQVFVPQAAPQGGGNLLMQQQLRLLQTLQQQAHAQQQQTVAESQKVQQSAPSVQAIAAGQAGSFTDDRNTKTSLADCGATGPTPAAKNTQRLKKKATTSRSASKPALAGAAKPQAMGVIGNTMKSLNNTMKRIHSEMSQQQKISESPSKSPLVTTQGGTPSGTTLRVDNYLINECNTDELIMNQNQLMHQQQTIPVAACANAQANPSLINTSYSLPPASSAAVASNNMNTLSSDTDGEFFTRKKGKISDKYVTESGTDDDVMLLGTSLSAAEDGCNESNT
jgi:hypothetical protein